MERHQIAQNSWFLATKSIGSIAWMPQKFRCLLRKERTQPDPFLPLTKKVWLRVSNGRSAVHSVYNDHHQKNSTKSITCYYWHQLIISESIEGIHMEDVVVLKVTGFNTDQHHIANIFWGGRLFTWSKPIAVCSINHIYTPLTENIVVRLRFLLIVKKINFVLTNLMMIGR